jgi:CBS domain-containing protein
VNTLLQLQGDENEMRISTLMENPVLRITEETTVKEAAETMGKNRVGSLLVTREDVDVSIVTERDILSKVITAQRDLDKTYVKDIASQPLITVDKDMDAEQVLELMANLKVRRILITDQENIVGIFSTSDLIKLPAMSR